MVLEEGEAPDEDPPLFVPQPAASTTVSGIIIERHVTRVPGLAAELPDVEPPLALLEVRALRCAGRRHCACLLACQTSGYLHASSHSQIATRIAHVSSDM